MTEICCIGHITADKVVTTRSIKYMAGGTAWYFSWAVSKLNLDYLLATALAETELKYVAELRESGIGVHVQPSAHTVYFENIYGENQDDRTQNVLAKADAFETDQFKNIDAGLFHLGPLLADDIGTPLIKALAAKSKVSLDVQGYLRKVENQKVYATDWPGKKEALQYIDIIKADVAELQALTGCATTADGAKQLADWGVKEIVITNGSGGSAIYADGSVYTIPAWRPRNIVDATGCGDTYMAGYLYRRSKGDEIQTAGEFAAGMASLKMENSGPFLGTEDDVLEFLKNR